MSSTNLVKKNLFTKPYLITLDELNQIGQDINLVGYDPQLNLTSDDTNVVLKYGIPCSPKLLNWVEPYQIAGIDYTLFYTEVNSGFSIGDRVFIINGTYDSNLLITSDKYKKGHDGYKVLFVDRCQVVLDIEFNGSLPSNEGTEPSDDLDNLVKVYYVKDQNDFIHVNRQITTRNGSLTGVIDYRFNQNQNNIIFVDSDYQATGPWGESLGLYGAPGFFIKNGTASWIDISNDFMIGSYSIATASNASNKIVILNNSFEFIGYTFQENLVYSYETTGTFSGWQVNVKHENKNVPLISKSNFRNGTFNGNWNGGIYGSNDKRITWGSTSSIWNSGTLLNTIWEKGIMESKQSQPQSYISEFDNIVGTFGAPYQKSTNPDNDGYGYNFVINSEIRNAVINNANVSNSILGTSSTSYSIVEEHLSGTLTSQFITNHFSNTLINKAYFESCGIQNANIQNSVVKNSRVENSRFYNVKSINTHYKKSLFKNSNYISDNTTKILHFEETDFSQNGTIPTHKIYKFYINKRSYEKFKFKDTFYIKGLKINNGSNSLLNFFDKKFKIGPYIDYVDQFDTNNQKWYKRGTEYNCTISTTKENEYFSDVNITAPISSNVITNQDPFGYSIDIFVSLNDIQGIPQTTYTYSDIIDYSEAYILNSDFESGVFENSNWNSGNHLNFSNDVNITYNSSNNPFWYLGGNNGDIANNGGYYDISLVTGTSSLNIKTFYSSNPTVGNTYPELEQDYLANDEIVFLNAVDYDTRGKVVSITFSGTGSNYLAASNLSTVYTGTGTGLTVDITASGIGEVTATGFTLSYIGSGMIPGLQAYSTYTNQPGAHDLVLSMFNGDANTLSILTPGLGYVVGCTVSVLRGVGYDNDILTITSVNNGAVLSVNVNYPGLGYSEGDVLTIIQPGAGASGATFSVTGITGSLTRLPDQYKIVNNLQQGNYQLQEIIATGSTSILPNLLPNGKFSSYDANNRYGYLHKTKFYRSKIVSGIFRKAYFNTSLIKNELYDVSDRDFNNIEKIKALLIVDSIFSGNSNILSKATYMNSYFVNGSDIWENGILYNSIWNGMTFTNGLVKSSTWLDGVFSNGLFYSSNTFDGADQKVYNQNNINSFYKSGITKNGLLNNRLSWQKGTFLNGEFYKSDWENGKFNGGKFYYSKFYGGVINGGIIGDKSISTGYTKVYSGTVNYTTVENAEVIAQPTNNITYASTSIQWNNGIFNDGIFSTLNNFNIATWSGGIFNGGDFTGFAKWLNGIFNGGKFTSIYNSNLLSLYDPISDIKDNYSWEYGVFNGGEFGTGTGSNSSWFDGEFNGGYFKGKVWNNGVFTFGEFSGSGKTQSGYYATGATESANAQKFVTSFTQIGGVSTVIDPNTYGIWKDGFVTDTKDRYVNRRIYNDSKRVSDTDKIIKTALIRDMIWMSGTFSHPSGTIQNSVWLDGTFENGTFKLSSFNPYVTRNIFSQPLSGQAFSISDTCIWKNGNLVDSDFYISNWENGNFISGNGYGMIWKNGIVSYMNAYNIFWENGLWRNGNWYGSNFNLNTDGSVTDDFARQILFRGMNWGGTSSCHVWNVFYNESLSDINSSIVSPANTVAWVPNTNNTNSAPYWLSNNSFGLALRITIVYFDTGLDTDRVGIDISISTLITSNLSDLSQNAEWQISTDNVNWNSSSTVNNTSQYIYTYTGLGDTYFRIKDGSVYSNVLKYTQVQPQLRTLTLIHSKNVILPYSDIIIQNSIDTNFVLGSNLTDAPPNTSYIQTTCSVLSGTSLDFYATNDASDTTFVVSIHTIITGVVLTIPDVQGLESAYQNFTFIMPDNDVTINVTSGKVEPGYSILGDIQTPLQPSPLFPGSDGDNPTSTGTLVVNNAPVTLLLKAHCPSGGQTCTAEGHADVRLNGTPILGSPFITAVAQSNVSSSINTKSILIPISTNGTYNVEITGYFTQANFLNIGSVTLE